jgi:glutamyl-tRNA synthetase
MTGRLAPSPTGGLHLGHARTFLVAWLSARSQRGRVILRIEDLDVSRVRPGAAKGAIDDLHWLGFDWDEGPFVQSERLDHYVQALEVLKSANLVYPCTCTRAEIARAASAPHAEEEGPSYPGTCSYRSADDAVGLGDRSFAWRFRVPAGPVAWDDLLQGGLELDPSIGGGDFLVGRPGSGPSYQLAVVVDDATMGVTEVVRGVDLVPSTPRQILLYRALGCDVPRFGHVGLVHSPDGRRLAKRDGSVKLATLREQGVDPRALIGRLALSLGLSSSGSACTPEELVPHYSVRLVNSEGWSMNASVLDRKNEGPGSSEAKGMVRS